MSDLRELYQEVILDHNRSPRNFGPLEGADLRADGHNPLCGDRLSVALKVEDGLVTDVRFEGSGCAISKASASLMTERIKGQTIDEARALFDRFHRLLTDQTAPTDDAALGKLAVFAGVRDYPARVKCAVLAWHTLRAAVDDNHELVSTE
ncbi:MAG: SUF system NifU family Fe-S cluster assembly protein [Acidobacteria bacterium]|mgnify:CR=1 FL=1|jgi:nitrogen fixation NifU-like protein|nr:SUF system NifU family Fe-S cluster assembly protein [Acidobacteriota bacterium]MDP7337902.1 SUF system NifU family Fe-S cluster assembly protein [Vicinamibacterales bacterium]MDP7480394.1 SUF system NifU family Fe-S cluster assembly protein [Vicinamibacterales bacterium]HJN43928.1 SUF system NifU family Fe-S cluster assembly protein [Vicinamibacterales bacterium]|tara:strand:+ start:1448 stop:1897 length:450 start_codon:yes stop_codon:yes gene_type:complete